MDELELIACGCATVAIAGVFILNSYMVKKENKHKAGLENYGYPVKSDSHVSAIAEVFKKKDTNNIILNFSGNTFAIGDKALEQIAEILGKVKVVK